MSRRKGVPQLLTRPSPSTGRTLAYARFDRRVVSFGAMGPEAERAFQKTLAEWLANGQRLLGGDEEELTVADVIATYLEHAENTVQRRCKSASVAGDRRLWMASLFGLAPSAATGNAMAHRRKRCALGDSLVPQAWIPMRLRRVCGCAPRPQPAHALDRTL